MGWETYNNLKTEPGMQIISRNLMKPPPKNSYKSTER